MIPYVVLFSILVLCGIYEVCRKPRMAVLGNTVIKPQSKRYYLIIPILVILVMGIFRETTMGYDSDTYYQYYWSCIDSYSWLYLLTHFSIDNGFFIVLKVIAIFTRDWWLARAVLFVLTFSLYYHFIARYSEYPAVSLIIVLGLALFGLMFSILRQALAGAISLFAYKQIRKGSVFKCVLFILLACTVHKSAILCVFMVVFYVLHLKKFTGFKLIVFSILAYFIFIIGIPLIALIYADSRYSGGTTRDGGYGMLLFMAAITALILRMFKLTGTNRDKGLGYMFNLSCGALMIQVGSLMWSLLTRTTVFFSFYWCLLIPNLICRLPKNKRIIYFIIVATLFGFMFFYQLSGVDMYVFHRFH